MPRFNLQMMIEFDDVTIERRMSRQTMPNSCHEQRPRRKQGELTRGAISDTASSVLIKRINHARFINERREIILSSGAERAREDRGDKETSIALIIPTIPLQN